MQKVPITELLYTSFDPSLPKPIAFNGWRHHLSFIKNAIAYFSSDQSLTQSFINQIDTIKGSLLDLYIDDLSALDISEEIVKYLSENKIFDKQKYAEWIISSGKGFRKISISDGSSWTLTLGRFPERYVHLHPSRYSPNSVRVRSTTLKTVILYFLIQNNIDISLEFENLNSIRVTYLKLSPVKSFTSQSQILKLINIFKTI